MYQTWRKKMQINQIGYLLLKFHKTYQKNLLSDWIRYKFIFYLIPNPSLMHVSVMMISSFFFKSYLLAASSTHLSLRNRTWGSLARPSYSTDLAKVRRYCIMNYEQSYVLILSHEMILIPFINMYFIVKKIPHSQLIKRLKQKFIDLWFEHEYKIYNILIRAGWNRKLMCTI